MPTRRVDYDEGWTTGAADANQNGRIIRGIGVSDAIYLEKKIPRGVSLYFDDSFVVRVRERFLFFNFPRC